MSAYGLFLLLIFALLIAAAVVMFLPVRHSQTKAGAPAGRQPSSPVFRDDDRYWYATFFYYNPDDPDPFVPKRYSLGWTINFGHPMGKLIGALMIAMVLLPVALALFDPGLNSSFGCHPSGCHPLP